MSPPLARLLDIGGNLKPLQPLAYSLNELLPILAVGVRTGPLDLVGFVKAIPPQVILLLR